MKAKVLLLLAVFLLATGFGNCEAKEEEKPADPLDAEITDTAENEAKPTLELIDFVPFPPKKNKERWFNIVITIGNNRPGDSTFFFPENPEFEPASSPRETAKGNNDWVNNSKEPLLCVAFEEKRFATFRWWCQGFLVVS